MTDNRTRAHELGQRIADNLNRNVEARGQQSDLEAALSAAGIRFEHTGHAAHDLSLSLVDHGIVIRVNRRSRDGDEQLGTEDGMIVVQGEAAVQFLTTLLKSCEIGPGAGQT